MLFELGNTCWVSSVQGTEWCPANGVVWLLVPPACSRAPSRSLLEHLVLLSQEKAESEAAHELFWLLLSCAGSWMMLG